MNCQHKRIRVWRIKNGWTQKCLDCGAKRRGMELPPSGYRDYVQGPMSVDINGKVSVELIDVTSCFGETSYSDWR